MRGAVGRDEVDRRRAHRAAPGSRAASGRSGDGLHGCRRPAVPPAGMLTAATGVGAAVSTAAGRTRVPRGRRRPRAAGRAGPPAPARRPATRAPAPSASPRGTRASLVGELARTTGAGDAAPAAPGANPGSSSRRARRPASVVPGSPSRRHGAWARPPSSPAPRRGRRLARSSAGVAAGRVVTGLQGPPVRLAVRGSELLRHVRRRSVREAPGPPWRSSLPRADRRSRPGARSGPGGGAGRRAESVARPRVETVRSERDRDLGDDAGGRGHGAGRPGRSSGRACAGSTRRGRRRTGSARWPTSAPRR